MVLSDIPVADVETNIGRELLHIPPPAESIQSLWDEDWGVRLMKKLHSTTILPLSHGMPKLTTPDCQTKHYLWNCRRLWILQPITWTDQDCQASISAGTSKQLLLTRNLSHSVARCFEECTNANPVLEQTLPLTRTAQELWPIMFHKWNSEALFRRIYRTTIHAVAFARGLLIA